MIKTAVLDEDEPIEEDLSVTVPTLQAPPTDESTQPTIAD